MRSTRSNYIHNYWDALSLVKASKIVQRIFQEFNIGSNLLLDTSVQMWLTKNILHGYSVWKIFISGRICPLLFYFFHLTGLNIFPNSRKFCFTPLTFSSFLSPIQVTRGIVWTPPHYIFDIFEQMSVKILHKNFSGVNAY